MMRVFLLLGITAATLMGCSSALPGWDAVSSGAVDQAVRDRMTYNDRKAAIINALACDMSIGAYARMPEGDVKRGVALICGLGRAPESLPPL